MSGSHTASSQDAISVLLLPSPGLASGTMFNTVVFVAGIQVLLRGLTWAGVLNSWLLGTLVFSAFGWGGYVLVCLYFLFGTAVRQGRKLCKARIMDCNTASSGYQGQVGREAGCRHRRGAFRAAWAGALLSRALHCLLRATIACFAE